MDYQLQGKRALVTGSSSGIGTGIARALAAEGASVMVHGRNPERTAQVAADLAATGVQVATTIGDVGTDEGAAEVVRATTEAFGGVDILVNNAGGSSEEDEVSWFKVPLEEWVTSYQKNVIGSARLIHQFVPGMRERGWGRVIQISSMAGVIPTSAQPDYGPSKAAMNNMALGLAKALKGTGVTVNTVSPGMIMTPGLKDFLTTFAEKRGWGDDIDQAAQYVLKGSGQTVLKIGQPADIAYAVTWLASPLADFVNGLNMHMDGGATAHVY